MTIKFRNPQHMLMNEFNEVESSGSDSSMDINEAELPQDDSDSSEIPLEASGDGLELPEALEEEINEAIEDGASEAEIKSMIKKFQLKVNGKEKEVEIDLSDEEAVKRELQKSYAFSEKAKEANELKKTYQEALNELLNDPISVLASLGVNVDELSSKHILNKIEDEQKSPEQKESERMAKELETYRKKIQEIEKEKKEAIEREQSAKVMASLEKELDEAWKTSGVVIPKTPEFITRVADAIDWAESLVDEITGERLYPNVSIADVLPLVEQEYFSRFNEILDVAPEEALSRYNLSKAVKKQVEKKPAPAKKAPTNVSNLNKANAQSKQITSEDKPSERKLSARDFFDNLK